jgi:methyltransferase (TIGR00027 family)
VIKSSNSPDSTAVRVALWRALHLELDAAPHILKDDIGLKLYKPLEGWRERPDMHPRGTAPFRASIVIRSRFIEDMVKEKIKEGLLQYVILGAGLDTFAQREPEILSRLSIFEIDKPETQAWKIERLKELNYKISTNLHFVPVNFETKESWIDKLQAHGFDSNKPALITSLGVSMYLTLDAIVETLSSIATLSPGSIFIMTFMLPLDLVRPQDKFGYERSLKGAQASGTPFISFFTPEEMSKLAISCGFKKVECTSTLKLAPRYFANRSDGLEPSSGEEILIAMT